MEWLDLYRYVLPPGDNVPIFVKPFLVEVSVPMEDDIEWVVNRIGNNRSKGTSWMRDENIKGWMAEAQKEEAEVEQTAVAEGTSEVLGGTGEGGGGGDLGEEACRDDKLG